MTRPIKGEIVWRTRSPNSGMVAGAARNAVGSGCREIIAGREHQATHAVGVIEGEGHRHLCAPRVPEYQRTDKLSESLAEEIGLVFGAPHSVPGTFAVAVARPIKGNDAVALSGFIHEAADLHVGDHRPVGCVVVNGVGKRLLAFLDVSARLLCRD
jgi:hypothetical protein